MLLTDSTNETIGEETPPVETPPVEIPPVETPPAPERKLTWLEQFDAFKSEAIAELKKVVEMGLEPLENEALIRLSAELIILAEKHNPQALEEVTSIINTRTFEQRT